MSLLEFLKRDESARLIFGKKELAIIRKQLLGERMTQSQRNRLSKFIRPKLQFIEDCSKYGEEFKLKRRNTLDALVENAKQVILADKMSNKIQAIMLFGSRVSGYTTFRSDVDMCVLFNDISKDEAFEFQLRVSSKLPEIVDIRVFNTLPLKVKIGVIGAHKIIYKSHKLNPLFWADAVKEASESRVMLYANTR